MKGIAADASADPAVLAVVAHAAVLPLLLAAGTQAASVVESISWEQGYCPLCAAWPTLGEVRGLSRDFVLRCGRCASGWRLPQPCCVYCGNEDQQRQSYFAGEDERESRRANVCDTCRGYLKSITTLGPLSAEELLLRDLQSLELDVTALEHGYERPDRPGWELDVRVRPSAPLATPGSTGGWRRFWR
jgi:FdhE protein